MIEKYQNLIGKIILSIAIIIAALIIAGALNDFAIRMVRALGYM